ncbi:MAG: hypothetical protein DRG50_01235 [Deltaproteobacteria bacterium]|nr:MAG: hypothetical protein DRG50_01235 [Deltaproteobacteria bacterium]
MAPFAMQMGSGAWVSPDKIKKEERETTKHNLYPFLLEFFLYFFIISFLNVKGGVATAAEDEQSKEKTYSLVKEFVDKFRSRNGTIVCKELLGCDISTPEGRELAREKGLFITICPKFVQDAAEIVEQKLR